MEILGEDELIITTNENSNCTTFDVITLDEVLWEEDTELEDILNGSNNGTS